MSKINLADSFGQWADQFIETPILEQFDPESYYEEH